LFSPLIFIPTFQPFAVIPLQSHLQFDNPKPVYFRADSP
jgi:hypothetical protein